MDTIFWFELGGVFTGVCAGAISAIFFLVRKRKIKLRTPVDLKMPASCNWDVHTIAHS